MDDLFSPFLDDDGHANSAQPQGGTSMDLDDDGIADAIDSDGDGVLDQYDTDGDGIIDAFDSDHNGTIDTFLTTEDSDEDGVPDMVTQTTYLDQDGNGIIDTILMQHDTDLNGITDIMQTIFLDQGIPEAAEQFLPDDSDVIVGEPEEDIEHWEFQGNTNRCAVFAQMFAIEELLDIDIDPDELTQVAEENGWFDNGTPPNAVGKLMEYYGLQTETGNGTIEDIQHCLDNGGKVVVGLDSSEIWEGPDHESMFSPGQQADHAVEVIGIDYSDPGHPMVILNDSGTPDGAGEMVPLDQFMDAWQDSGCMMVEAYK